MRTVKNKKELIEGIKAGERNFKIEGKLLYYQCKLVSMFNKASAKEYTEGITDKAMAVMGEWGIVAIVGIVVSGAIAILAILKKRGLTIEIEGPVGKGTLRVS